jgi:hypothetical protein
MKSKNEFMTIATIIGVLCVVLQCSKDMAVSAEPSNWFDVEKIDGKNPKI